MSSETATPSLASTMSQLILEGEKNRLELELERQT